MKSFALGCTAAIVLGGITGTVIVVGLVGIGVLAHVGFDLLRVGWLTLG